MKDGRTEKPLISFSCLLFLSLSLTLISAQSQSQYLTERARSYSSEKFYFIAHLTIPYFDSHDRLKRRITMEHTDPYTQQQRKANYYYFIFIHRFSFFLLLFYSSLRIKMRRE